MIIKIIINNNFDKNEDIVSALGLVTLSSIVVDQLALYVLPRKRQYFKVNYPFY